MMKYTKLIFWSVIFFFTAAVAGWFFFGHLALFLNTEGVQIVSTGMSDVFFIKLRFAGFTGLLGSAIFLGTVVPKWSGLLVRMLVIAVPVITLCLLMILQVRSSLRKLIEIPGMVYPVIISVRNLKIELVPFTGLIAAVALSFLLYKKGSGQEP